MEASGHPTDFVTQGTAAYFVVVLAVSLQLMLDAYHWNLLWFFFIFGSVLVFLPIIFLYSSMPEMGYNVLGVAPYLFSSIHLDLV